MNVILCHNNFSFYSTHVNLLNYIMQSFPPTIILRHQRENLKKCSLRGLESRTDFRFFKYPHCHLPELSNYVILTLDAPQLTKEDHPFGIFLIDSTWRYADKMLRFVENQKILKKKKHSYFFSNSLSSQTRRLFRSCTRISFY